MRTLNQASAFCRQVPSALVAEALAVKVALIAVHNADIRSLTLCSDSQSLVTLLNSSDVINELKTILYDIRCLSINFTYLSFVFFISLGKCCRRCFS